MTSGYEMARVAIRCELFTEAKLFMSSRGRLNFWPMTGALQLDKAGLKVVRLLEKTGRSFSRT